MIKVKAIRDGYYDHKRRRPGTKSEFFSIKDESEFSKEWMAKVDAKGGAAGKQKPGKKSEESQEEPLAEDQVI
jgi:hypothetical protein